MLDSEMSIGDDMDDIQRDRSPAGTTTEQPMEGGDQPRSFNPSNVNQMGKAAVGAISTSWREFARCKGVDPEIFYPTSDDEEAADEAKAICAMCPVREPCLEFALSTREKNGVWGGLTESARRRVLRRRRKTA